MTAGYDLREGKYDKSCKSVSDIKRKLQPFFDSSLKKESTYKYAMIQAILDNVDNASSKTYKITFDQLYYRFSEIYWVLVFKYNIPQKAPSDKTPKTFAEKIIENIVEKYQIRRKTDFRSLPNDVKNEIVQQMKCKCSRYVIGALYADTNKVMYSFSKQKEWVKLNPLFVDYVKKHKKRILLNNYQAWARFYADKAAKKNRDVGYYQRLLKREFSNFTVEKLSQPVKGIREARTSLRNLESIQSGYDPNTAKKVQKVLKQYPELGLYLAQVCEKVESDKKTVRSILEKAFWCRQEGSRYYYKDISDSDILEEALFSKQEEIIQEEFCEKPEIDPEKLRLLDDPEQLIKQLKREKGIIRKNTENLSVVLKQKSDSKIVPKHRKWDREEVVILVTEYFRTKDLPPKEIEESYRKISEFLRKREEILTGTSVDSTFRNYAGVRMQSSRIQSLDPENKNAGMQGTKLQKEVVQEYLIESERLMNEAKMVLKKYKYPDDLPK